MWSVECRFELTHFVVEALFSRVKVIVRYSEVGVKNNRHVRAIVSKPGSKIKKKSGTKQIQ